MPDDISIEEALKAVNAASYERLRVEHMGWRFGPATIIGTCGGYEMRMSFTCVCGRREEFRRVVPKLHLFRHDDPVEWLVRNGSFSREHLQQDGYTGEQITEIERRGEEFDRLVAERYERDLMRRFPESFCALQREKAILRRSVFDAR